MTDYQPTAIFREIASRLRGRIARFDVNQADLAALCDVSQSQFSKIIRGVRPMTIDQLAVLCESLEMDMSKILASVEQFVRDRDLISSPVHFVVDEERVEPHLYGGNGLDDWGKAARERMRVRGFVEYGQHDADLKEDFDLAASADDSVVDPDRQA